MEEMSQDQVKHAVCELCEEATHQPIAITINVNTAGSGEGFSLFICPGCAVDVVREDKAAGKGPGLHVLDVCKDLIVAGLKKLAGI